MPIDLDQHPEVVIETIRQMTDAVVAQLRKMALWAHDHPDITAEKALEGSAVVVERTLADIAQKFQHISRSEH